MKKVAIALLFPVLCIGMSVRAEYTWKEYLNDLWQGKTIEDKIGDASIRWDKRTRAFYNCHREFPHISYNGKLMISAALESNLARFRELVSSKNAFQEMTSEKIILEQMAPQSALDIALAKEEDMCGLSRKHQGYDGYYSPIHSYCRDAKRIIDMFRSIAASAGKNIDADRNVQKVLNKRK